MLVDRTVLARMSAIWHREGGDLFSKRWSNLVAGWAIDYFSKYEKAPGRSVEDLFYAWSEKTHDEDTKESVEKFLRGLSKEWEVTDINPQSVIDQGAEYFNRVKISKLQSKVKGEIERGRTNDAIQHINDFSQIQLGLGESINPFQEKEIIHESFEQAETSLITFKGPHRDGLARFFGNQFRRDSFVSILGSEKSGKSFYLLDIAWRGLLARNKIAFFECGDHSRNQVIRRFATRAAGRPIKAGSFQYPTDIWRDKSGKINVDCETYKHKEPLDWRQAWQAFQKIKNDYVKTEKEMFRLTCYPTGMLSTEMIREKIKTWQREDWTPDLVIIDYADIIAPSSKFKDKRDQINDIWINLRALSLEFHCCVVTATQADAKSYEAGTLSLKHFSEDKRKFGHVTGMFGLNQTEDERQSGLMRLNWLVLRDTAIPLTKFVHVAECRSIAKPAVRSLV